MQKIKRTKPGYFYYKGKRISRYTMAKHRLVKMGYDRDKTEFEICDELGFLRCYNTG